LLGQRTTAEISFQCLRSGIASDRISEHASEEQVLQSGISVRRLNNSRRQRGKISGFCACNRQQPLARLL
jgi:hypothetical protein